MEKEEKILNVLLKASSKYDYDLVADLVELLGPFDLKKPQIEMLVNKMLRNAEAKSIQRACEALLDSGLDLETPMWSPSLYKEAAGTEDQNSRISFIEKLLKEGRAPLVVSLMKKRNYNDNQILTVLENFEQQRIQKYSSYRTIYRQFFEHENLSLILSLEGFDVNKKIEGAPFFYFIKDAKQLEQCIKAGAYFDLTVPEGGASFINKLKDIEKKEERLGCFEVYEKWRKEQIKTLKESGAYEGVKHSMQDVSAIEAAVGNHSVGVLEIKKMLKISGLTFESFKNEKGESLPVVILKKRRWDLFNWLEKENVDVLTLKESDGEIALRHLFLIEYALKGKKVDQAKMLFLEKIGKKSIKEIDVISAMSTLGKSVVDSVFFSRYLRMHQKVHPQEAVSLTLRAAEAGYLLYFEINDKMQKEGILDECNEKTLMHWMRTIIEKPSAKGYNESVDVESFKRAVKALTPKEKISNLINPQSLTWCWLHMIKNLPKGGYHWEKESWSSTFCSLIAFCAKEAGVDFMNLDIAYDTFKELINEKDSSFLTNIQLIKSQADSRRSSVLSNSSSFDKNQAIVNVFNLMEKNAFSLFLAIAKSPIESYEKRLSLMSFVEGGLEEKMQVSCPNALKDTSPLADWVLGLKSSAVDKVLSVSEKVLLDSVTKGSGEEKPALRL